MISQWTQNDVSINGVKIHYSRTRGNDKPALVLVHGFSDNGRCWIPVALELESEYDIVMPDMRGHGLSARVRPDELVDMAADLAGLIHHLQLDRPVVVGHSMGAIVTYQIGVRFPDLARALVLEDPAWWLPGSSSAPPPNPAENPFTNWVSSLETKTLDELLIECRRDHPTWPEDLVGAMCDAKKQLDPTIADIMGGKIHSPEAPWSTTLHNVPHPMLLLTGSPEKGAIVTPEVAAEVRRLNPRVQIENIPSAGHLIRFDQLSAFMARLEPFLRRSY